MRVHLIKWKSVDEFIVKHARSKISFEGFKEGIKHADWNSINDIQQTCLPQARHLALQI